MIFLLSCSHVVAVFALSEQGGELPMEPAVFRLS